MSKLLSIIYKTIIIAACVLSMSNASAQFGIIGTGTTTNTATTYPTPFGAYYSGQHAQYVYLTSELAGAGVNAGVLSAIAFYVTSLNGCGTLDSFTISMANVVPNAPVSFLSGGLTRVYYAAHYTPVLGWNIFPFSIPFVWNGTSNVLVDICHWNGVSTSTYNASVYLSGNSSVNNFTHTANPCGQTFSPVSYTLKPNVRIGNFPPCNGQPSAGTIVPSGTITACAGRVDTITSVNYSITGNAVLQWMQSTDGGTTWTPTTGGSGAATFRYITPPVTTAIRYHMVITCPTSGLRDSTADVVYSLLLPDYAALPFYEDFEQWTSVCDSGDVPAAYWRNVPYHGNRSWRRDDSGVYAGWTMPLSGTYLPASKSGLHSARYHAYAAPAGSINAGDLMLYVDCHLPVGSKALRFYLRTHAAGIAGDSLQVQLSRDGGATFAPVGAFGPGSGGWDLKTLTIASDSPRTVLRFRAFAQAGGYSDIGLDSLSLIHMPASGVGGAARSEFIIQPNPAKGALTIHTNRGGTFWLTDLTGRQILLAPVGADARVSLTHVTPGIYFYHFLDRDNYITAGKLIVIE